MKVTRIVIIGIFLLICCLWVDFPAAKITLYGAVVLVLVNLFYTRFIKKHYVLKRYLETNKVFIGVGETNSLIVANDAFLPLHAIILSDYTDLNIAGEQNHPFLFSIAPSSSEIASYQLFGRKRGKYRIGPTVVRFTDLVGLFSFSVEVNTVKEVIVFPNILKVSNMPYKSMQPYGAIRNKVPIFEDPSIITGLKEYSFGDEIKKINWKVSAKFDKFYVNTYQPSISSASVILLNMLDDDYRFRNKDYYIERGIEVAASLVQELYLTRQELAFTSNCRIDKNDSMLVTDLAKGEVHYTDILTQLSIMEANKKMVLRDVLDPAKMNLSWGTSIYVITPRIDDIALYKLIDIQHAGHSITVINIGPEIQADMSLWNIGFQSFYAEFQGNIINLLRI